MFLQKQQLKKIKPAFIFSIFFLFVVMLQHGCKKTDNAAASIANQTATFFTLPGNTPSAVQRVAENLKQQNNTKTFTDQFIQQEGMPRWDKASISVSSNTIATATRSLGKDEVKPDTTVIIPIVPDKGDHVSAFFLATVNDSVSVKLYRNSDYKRFPYDNGRPKTGTTAEEFALRMMEMDRCIFGYTKFQIKDSLLFGGRETIDTRKKITKEVDLGNNNSGPGNNLIQMVCVTITYTTTTTVNSCPYGPGNCNGPNGMCDNCPLCVTSTSTTSSNTFCDVVYNEGGGGTSWPIFPPGGGGGGGTGGGGTPCPIPSPFVASVIPTSCQDPIPNPWPPQPPYQFTPNDIRVINELNQEDNETDNIFTSNECQGTKRSGNINFNGTKEHWLIQLDYVSRNPINGEIEYAIPQSSAAGNRGYADIVNKQSNEIFEIKPNNAQGIQQGGIEVERYVLKANAFCATAPGSFPPAWHAGTDYAKRYLPSTDASKFLVAEKVASGVIGYKYEDKVNTPNPAPIVIPSDILDKLRELVEKLKNHLNDFDRIILEYLNQHPELVTYIKTSAIGAAVAVVVGTIIEDFATGGAGIFDDWASFTLAYRIVRFAWKL